MKGSSTFLMMAFLILIAGGAALSRGIYVGSEAVPRPSPDGIIWFMKCLYLYPGKIRHVPVGMGKTVDEAYATHRCKSFDN